MVYASIDLDGMADLVRELENAASCLHTVVHSLRAKADRADVPTTALTHIDQIASWADDELPGLRRRLHLAIAADAQRSSALRGTPVQITEPTMSMAQATALGNDLAARVADGDLIGDPAAFDQLAQEIATYSGDPDVMGAMVDRLGAAGLLDVMTRVAVPPQNASATIDPGTREQMLIALRAGLNTADTMWSGVQSAAFATALVGASTGDGSCSALSYLLHDSYYSDAFLTAAAEAIDTFDRTGWDGNPGQWSPDTGQGQYWDLYFPDDAKTAYTDPAISLMSALGNNPAVALDFFAGDGDLMFAEGQVTEREYYWLHERAWGDGFAHLSGALAAATTDPDLIDPPSLVSAGRAAGLASQVVNLLGHRPDLDSGMLNDDSNPAAQNLASILSTYMLAADYASNSANPPEWWGGRSDSAEFWFGEGSWENTPMFAGQSLRRFIWLSSSTPSGAATLREGLDAYAGAKYAVAVAVRGGSPTDETTKNWLDEAIKTQAMLEGQFAQVVGQAAITGARGQDATRRAWLSLASDVIGTIPVGKYATDLGGGAAESIVASFVVNQARGAGTRYSSQQWATLEQQAVARATGEAELARVRCLFTAARAVVGDDRLYTGSRQGPLWTPEGDLISWAGYRDLESSTDFDNLLVPGDRGIGNHLDQGDTEAAFDDQFDGLFDEEPDLSPSAAEPPTRVQES